MTELEKHLLVNIIDIITDSSENHQMDAKLGGKFEEQKHTDIISKYLLTVYIFYQKGKL